MIISITRGLQVMLKKTLAPIVFLFCRLDISIFIAFNKTIKAFFFLPGNIKKRDVQLHMSSD